MASNVEDWGVEVDSHEKGRRGVDLEGERKRGREGGRIVVWRSVAGAEGD